MHICSFRLNDKRMENDRITPFPFSRSVPDNEYSLEKKIKIAIFPKAVGYELNKGTCKFVGATLWKVLWKVIQPILNEKQDIKFDVVLKQSLLFMAALHSG